MVLFEREPHLKQLQELYRDVETGKPHIVLLSGEAGVGKTVLLKSFRKGAEVAGAEILWGMCDDLYTPQALAPFYDIAYQLGGELIDLLPNAANLNLIGQSLLARFKKIKRPILLIIEDIHWADEGTLDLIRFLNRRIDRLPIICVLSIRLEGKLRRPVQALLGGMPADLTTRINLAPFKLETVTQLAEDNPAVDGHTLYQLTQGNPFFVIEFLKAERADHGEMPETVRDAVLGQVTRLTADVRSLVETVSVIPNQAEDWLIQSVCQPDDLVLQTLQASSIIRHADNYYRFRHELARRIVLDSLSIQQRKDLHQKIFETLYAHRETQKVRLARLVHHAAYAELGESVIELAPEAAVQARKVKAYREAAAHYATALQYCHLLTPVEIASLLEARSKNSFFVDWEVALATLKQAQTIRAELGDQFRQGDNYQKMSLLAWGLSRNREAHQYALLAVKLLKRLPPSRALAKAYVQLDYFHTIMGHLSKAGFWNKTALAFSEKIGASKSYLDAILNRGIVQSDTGKELQAVAEFKRVIQLATELESVEHLARCYTNLAQTYFYLPDMEQGFHYCAQGEKFLSEHERSVNLHYLMVLKAEALMHRGEWQAAIDLCEPIIDYYPKVGPIGVTGLSVLALIRAKKGEPIAASILNPLVELSESDRLDPRLINDIYLTHAQIAWQRGDQSTCKRWAQALLNNLTRKRQDRWQKRGFALLWLHRCGQKVEPNGRLLEPIRLELNGEWAAAAKQWGKLDYKYEQGMAYAFGDQTGLEKAFEIFDGLGARPALDFVRRRMREIGMTSVPRGAYTTTRQNENRLTRRQVEVLKLVAKGLTNSEIGDRLHISAKTVGHHVSAILNKLDVSSRSEAVDVARTEKIVE